MTPLLALLLLGPPTAPTPVELRGETLAAFDHYVRSTQERFRRRVTRQKDFLWVDESADRRRRVQRGDVLVQPMNGSGAVAVPNGLVHDWLGVVFIPGATLAETFAVIHRYNDYKKVYHPGVVDSRLLRHDGNNYRFYLRLRRREVFTVVIDTVYDAHFYAVDPTHWYTLTRAVRVNEVKDAGEPHERYLEQGEDHGYLWGVYAHSRFAERDGGVYIEMESIALTRNIPFLLRWLVGPTVQRISRESMASALRATRVAVLDYMNQVRTASAR